MINKVFRKYQQKYSSFKFLGVVSIDFYKNNCCNIVFI